MTKNPTSNIQFKRVFQVVYVIARTKKVTEEFGGREFTQTTFEQRKTNILAKDELEAMDRVALQTSIDNPSAKRIDIVRVELAVYAANFLTEG